MKSVYRSLILLFIFSVVSSCEPSTRGDLNLYNGIEVVTAESDNLLSAINLAIKDGVRLSTLKLVGESVFKNNEQAIENSILNMKYQKAKTFIDSYESLGESEKAGIHSVTLSVQVNLVKLRSVLNKLNIPIQSYVSESQEHLNLDKLKNNTILVYYDKDKSKIPYDLAEQAINQINMFLSKKDLSYVELSQIEKLKSDREALEQESGGLSLNQILATSLHADIYILVDGNLDDGVYKDGRYITKGGINLSAFESSTAKGLGSANLSTSKQSGNLSESQHQVILDTTIPAIEKLLPMIIAYKERPESYSLTLLGAMSPTMTKSFERVIEQDQQTISFKLLNFTEEASNYEIQYRGLTRELVNGILAKLRSDEEFDGLKVKMLRFKEITLTLGLEE